MDLGRRHSRFDAAFAGLPPRERRKALRPGLALNRPRTKGLHILNSCVILGEKHNGKAGIGFQREGIYGSEQTKEQREKCDRRGIRTAKARKRSGNRAGGEPGGKTLRLRIFWRRLSQFVLRRFRQRGRHEEMGGSDRHSCPRISGLSIFSFGKRRRRKPWHRFFGRGFSGNGFLRLSEQLEAGQRQSGYHGELSGPG